MRLQSAVASWRAHRRNVQTESSARVVQRAASAQRARDAYGACIAAHTPWHWHFVFMFKNEIGAGGSGGGGGGPAAPHAANTCRCSSGACMPPLCCKAALIPSPITQPVQHPAQRHTLQRSTCQPQACKCSCPSFRSAVPSKRETFRFILSKQPL